jgi:hypothetical protein
VRLLGEGLRAEEKIAKFHCRGRHGQEHVLQMIKEIPRVGKQRVVGDTQDEPGGHAVNELPSEKEQLKAPAAELT